MPSFGENLRRARVESGLTIDELAARTKVAPKYLEAIESDRRNDLPAGFFFKNWTIQYARALSISEADILKEIDCISKSEAPLPLPGQDAVSAGPSNRHTKVGRSERSPRLLLSLSSLFLVVLASSGFYTWWHEHHQRVPGRAGAAIPEQTEATPPSTVPSLQRSSPQVSSPTPQSPERDTPAVTDAAAPATALGRDGLLVEIVAKQQTWLSISPDGKQVFSGVLEPNQSKTIVAKDSARLKIGNEGGLELRLNRQAVAQNLPEKTALRSAAKRRRNSHVAHKRIAPRKAEAAGA